MKILLIHNKYKAAGGEDAVFSAEAELLTRYRHDVEKLIFDNGCLKTLYDKVLSGLKLIYNPESARLLKDKIKVFEPDLIHVHNFFPIASPSILFVARKYGIPVILTLHNYRLICPSATLFHKNRIYERSIHTVFPWHAIVKGVYRKSVFQTAAVVFMTVVHSLIGTWRNKVDLYISLTDFARQKFVSSAIRIPPAKLIVKPNFIKDYGRGDLERKDYFLFVGRLTEEKGVRTLLNAARIGNFRLVVIGEGPLASLVMDHAQKNSNVSYLGYQEKGVVLDHMKSCKGLIFPSLWYEGFPITLLEALCSGTIVIASRLGGMAEIINHGENGLHFEPGNARELVSRIEDLYHNPAFFRSMAAKARLTYLENYTPEKNYSLLMGAYQRAMASAMQTHSKMVYRPVSTRFIQ